MIVEFENKDGGQWADASVISRAGNAKGKHSTWFNIENLWDSTQSCADFQSINKWEKLQYTDEIVNRFNIIKDERGNFSIIDAKKK